MEPTFLQRIAPALYSAAMTTAVFLAVLIPFAEQTPAFKNWLKIVFTHHWLGKSVLGIAVFIAVIIALGILWKNETWDNASLIRLMNRELVALAASALVLLAYFFWHALK